MAVWIPWARVLVCGDYLSPVEIPMLHGAAPDAYLATLARLEPLVEQAEHVVPGHGAPIDGTRAAAILREDRAYLEALLEHGEAAKLPLARRTGEQRRIHARTSNRLSLHDPDPGWPPPSSTAASERLAADPPRARPRRASRDELPRRHDHARGPRRRARAGAAARRRAAAPAPRSTTRATSPSSPARADGGLAR